MSRSGLRSLPILVVALVAMLLLVSCTNSVSSSPTPSPVVYLPTVTPSSLSPIGSFACDQPRPVSDKMTFVGLAYGPYHSGQDPSIHIENRSTKTVTTGIFPSTQEMQADMPTLATLTNYIRLYSSTGPAETLVREAQKKHLCVALGISLGKDRTKNAKEITAGIDLASRYQAVHMLIVGNEVLLRKDLGVQDLHGYIKDIRARLARSVAITVADTYDVWLNHPELAADVDVITVHIYPFWQGVAIDDALPALDQAYGKVTTAFPKKPIVIGETGWPSAGPPFNNAVPDGANQARYLQDFMDWAQKHNVFYFYFSAWDEEWKGSERGVGASWGFYQQDGTLKPDFQALLPEASPASLQERSTRDIFVGSGLEKPFDLGVNTSEGITNWVSDSKDPSQRSSSLDRILIFKYPAGQQWGAVFLTVGSSVPPEQRDEKHTIDMSAYNSIVFDMRAEGGGQCVKVGIKDWLQPDDGTEQKGDVCPGATWKTYRQHLSNFSQADQTHLYVVFEVVFAGPSPLIIELRNIRYSPD